MIKNQINIEILCFGFDMHLSFKNDMPPPCSWFNALASFGVFLTPYCLRQYGLLVPYFALWAQYGHFARLCARAFALVRIRRAFLVPMAHRLEAIQSEIDSQLEVLIAQCKAREFFDAFVVREFRNADGLIAFADAGTSHFEVAAHEQTDAVTRKVDALEPQRRVNRLLIDLDLTQRLLDLLSRCHIQSRKRVDNGHSKTIIDLSDASEEANRSLENRFQIGRTPTESRHEVRLEHVEVTREDKSQSVRIHAREHALRHDKRVVVDVSDAHTVIENWADVDFGRRHHAEHPSDTAIIANERRFRHRLYDVAFLATLFDTSILILSMDKRLGEEFAALHEEARQHRTANRRVPEEIRAIFCR